MATHIPDLPAGVHVGSLTYFPYATQLTTPSGELSASLYANMTLGAQTHGPQMFGVGFDTGINGDTLVYDYSTFDQDVFEATLATFLDAWCTYVVAVLGVTLEQAQASITVQRCWSIELDQKVLGSFVDYSVYDTMAYPPAS